MPSPPFRALAPVVGLAGGAVLALTAEPALADSSVTRTAGAERVTTAAAASAEHRDAADEALLAYADSFTEALPATTLATTADAPLLLTHRHELPGATADELERLGVERVRVLGDTETVGEGVVEGLDAAGYEVERVSGDDRYDTARKIARAAGPADTGEVVVALGDHPEPARAWPDAIAAGALASSPDALPILLTDHDRLPDATTRGLDELDAERVLLIGGEAAITAEVEEAIADTGAEVVRLAGASRWATSTAVAEDAVTRQGDDEHPLVLATGANFPDALGAGALAAELDGPLVLVPSAELTATTDDFLRAHHQRWSRGVLVGGPAAASPLVAEQVDAALRDEPQPEPGVEREAGDEDDDSDQDDEEVTDTFEGEASWYGDHFQGSATACGETYDQDELTAAHRELPCGTRVRVTNTANDLDVTVRVNDRGPYAGDRVLDLSRAAAEEIGMVSSGTAWVRAEVLAD